MSIYIYIYGEKDLEGPKRSQWLLPGIGFCGVEGILSPLTYKFFFV